MKKIILSLLSLLSLNAVNAANEVSIAPNTSLTANVADVIWVAIDIPEYNDALINITTDLQFPEGWIVSTTPADYSDQCKWDYDFEETGSVSHFTGAGAKNGSINRFLVYSSDTQPFKGHKGNFFAIKVKAPAGTPDGYYPVIVKSSTYACKSTIDEENVTFSRDLVSYIKVGNPDGMNVEVAPECDVTSSAVATLPAGATIDFSKATAVYGNSTNEVKSTYTRKVTNEWNTICLPFEAKSTEAVKFYSIDKVGEDFVEVIYKQSLNACEPALVKVAGETLTVEGTGVNTSALSPGTMVGTFEPIKVTDEGSYYIKDNKFLSKNEYFNVGAFKAYYQNVASAKGNVLDIIEEATAINAANADLNGIEEIYGVNGTRQQNLQNGLNIVKMGDKVMKVVVK